MRLRILAYLDNVQEYEGVALSAKLKCTCGATKFQFFHTGTQTRGILSPWIVRKQHQLRLKAVCAWCKESVIVYDSTVDGARPQAQAVEKEFVPLDSKKVPKQFPVVLKYNYEPEQFKTEGTYSNCFENCFIYLVDENGKEKALIEE